MKKRKVMFVPASDGYAEHYEVLERNLLKWKPLMTWHPMSGDRPMMFDSEIKAQEFIDAENKIITDRIEAKKNAINFGGHKIIFLPANTEYIAHYEVLEKAGSDWLPIMTFHPMSGDKPIMFDTEDNAKEFIEKYILKQTKTEEASFTVSNNVSAVVGKNKEESKDVSSKKIKI